MAELCEFGLSGGKLTSLVKIWSGGHGSSGGGLSRGEHHFKVILMDIFVGEKKSIFCVFSSKVLPHGSEKPKDGLKCFFLLVKKS